MTNMMTNMIIKFSLHYTPNALCWWYSDQDDKCHDRIDDKYHDKFVDKYDDKYDGEHNDKYDG